MIEDLEFTIKGEIKSLDEILDIDGQKKQATPYASDQPLL
jgi:hypothetical protein